MRRRRCFLPDQIHFVTIRTVEERFALDPYGCPNAWTLAEGKALTLEEKQAMRERGRACVEQTRSLTEEIARAERDATYLRKVVPHGTFTDSIPNIIGSCMARGIEKYRVRVYGFVWMSNHGHLLLGAAKDDFADFMAYLNGQIAVNVNRFLGRKHYLWARRYAAAPVLDQAAELEMLGYILANPPNAGIANSIDEWAGLSSAAFFFRDHKERFLHFDRTAWYHEGCPDDIAPFLSTTVLEQELLPQLSGLKPKKLRRKVRRAIKAKMQILNAESDRTPIRRRLQSRAVIPTDRPESFNGNPRKRSPQPLCHTTNHMMRKRHLVWYRDFRIAYEKSAREYRLGNVEVEFPEGSFPPSRYPRARHSGDPTLRTRPPG